MLHLRDVQIVEMNTGQTMREYPAVIRAIKQRKDTEGMNQPYQGKIDYQKSPTNSEKNYPH